MNHDGMSYVKNQLLESLRVKQLLTSDEKMIFNITQIGELCVKAFQQGNKVLLAGNGGSAADAQHWAAEWVSRFYYNRPGLPAIALTTDSSVLTAIGNDYGYEHVFRRQIEALGQPGDVFFAISTSGNSPSILRAVEEAKVRKLITVGFTGTNGGQLPSITDFCIQAPSQDTPRIQECHALVGHILCAYVEDRIFPEYNPKKNRPTEISSSTKL